MRFRQLAWASELCRQSQSNVPNIEATETFEIAEDPFFAQDLAQMAKAVNYRRWQFRLIAPYLTGKVLEIGGGIGNFTADLAGAADSVISLEPNEYCHRQLVEKTKAI